MAILILLLAGIAGATIIYVVNQRDNALWERNFAKQMEEQVRVWLEEERDRKMALRRELEEEKARMERFVQYAREEIDENERQRMTGSHGYPTALGEGPLEFGDQFRRTQVLPTVLAAQYHLPLMKAVTVRGASALVDRIIEDLAVQIARSMIQDGFLEVSMERDHSRDVEVFRARAVCANVQGQKSIADTKRKAEVSW